MLLKLQIPQNSGVSGLEEWTIVEFQASFTPNRGDSLEGLPAGEMRFINNIPYFKNGHQVFEGKVVELPEPRTLLRRAHDSGEVRAVAEIHRIICFEKAPIFDLADAFFSRQTETK